MPQIVNICATMKNCKLYSAQGKYLGSFSTYTWALLENLSRILKYLQQ